jgi:hypothetical protein
LACSVLVENTYGQVNRYWVALNPNHQPPPTRDGKGYVGFKFSDDFNQLIYNVNVHNMLFVIGWFIAKTWAKVIKVGVVNLGS